MNYYKVLANIFKKTNKLILSDGTIETLVTNILDQSVTFAMFKELYFICWGIMLISA